VCADLVLEDVKPLS